MSAGPTGFTRSSKRNFLARMGMMLGLGLLITAMLSHYDTVTMASSAVNLGIALLPLYFLFLGLNALEVKVEQRTPWWFAVGYRLIQRALKAVIWMGLGAYFYDIWQVSEELAYWQVGIFSVLVAIPKMVDAYMNEDQTLNRRSKQTEEAKFQ